MIGASNPRFCPDRLEFCHGLLAMQEVGIGEMSIEPPSQLGRGRSFEGLKTREAIVGCHQPRYGGLHNAANDPLMDLNSMPLVGERVRSPQFESVTESDQN